MQRKTILLSFLLMILGGTSPVWAEDTSVTFNGITWVGSHGILTFDDTNKVITGTTSNWGCVGVKTASEATISVEKDRLTWLVITGTNLNKGKIILEYMTLMEAILMSNTLMERAAQRKSYLISPSICRKRMVRAM